MINAAFFCDRDAIRKVRLQARTPVQVHEIAKHYLVLATTIGFQVLPEKPANSVAKATPAKP